MVCKIIVHVAINWYIGRDFEDAVEAFDGLMLQICLIEVKQKTDFAQRSS